MWWKARGGLGAASHGPLRGRLVLVQPVEPLEHEVEAELELALQSGAIGEVLLRMLQQVRVVAGGDDRHQFPHDLGVDIGSQAVSELPHREPEDVTVHGVVCAVCQLR